MIKKLLLLPLSVLLVLAVLSQIPLPRAALLSPEPEVLLEALNQPGPGANLVSVQPFLLAADYASAGRLSQKLDAYLDQAEQAGWLSERSLVVFPEHIGTWLVAEGESFLTFYSPDTGSALLWAALGNLPEFLRKLHREQAADPFAAALFKSKAALMAAQYQQIFSSLAERYRVTLVAGSIALPDPSVAAGNIQVGEGPIYNASFVFFADGTVAGPVRKQYPIESELPFTQAAHQPLPLFDTPAGKLGVLICADSWYPQAWQQMAGAEIVAVPSFSSPDNIWTQPWGGYNGAPMPADVNAADIGAISEGQAWQKYALGGRGKNLRGGINTFLRGNLWDLGDDGQTTAVIAGNIIQGQRRDGAVISSLWL